MAKYVYCILYRWHEQRESRSGAIRFVELIPASKHIVLDAETEREGGRVEYRVEGETSFDANEIIIPSRKLNMTLVGARVVGYTTDVAAAAAATAALP